MQQSLQVSHLSICCATKAETSATRKKINNTYIVLCLFSYYVGVLNKQTMQMEVHNAQLFNMQPVIPGRKKTNMLITVLEVTLMP